MKTFLEIKKAIDEGEYTLFINTQKLAFKAKEYLEEEYGIESVVDSSEGGGYLVRAA